jgi:hypothetical protein
MGSFSMTAPCQPLPRNLVEEMLQLVARAICDRPGENAAQCEGRTNHMVYSTLSFAPRDGLELMLASIAFGHFNLILDSMRDVFQGQADQLKAKTKTTIVALDRAMLEMIKELRETRRRPAAHSVEVAQHEAAEAALPRGGAEMPRSVAPMPEDLPLAAVPASSPRAASNLAPTSRSDATPLPPGDTAPHIATPAAQQSVSVAGQPPSHATPRPDLPAPNLPEWTEADEAALPGRIAANEVLMAALNEGIAEAWRAHRAEEAAIRAIA